MVTTSLLFPASTKTGKHTVHLDLTAQGKDGERKTFLEEYAPPLKSYQPPNPAEKAPRADEAKRTMPNTALAAKIARKTQSEAPHCHQHAMK